MYVNICMVIETERFIKWEITLSVLTRFIFNLLIFHNPHIYSLRSLIKI